MSERTDRGPKPRVRPQMNTETRRHDERSAYDRKAKYSKDPMDDAEVDLPDEEEDGVTDDRMDENELVDETPDADGTGKPPRRAGSGE